MTRGVKICLAAVAAIFLCAVIALIYVLRPSESSFIEIIQDGKVIEKLDISKEEDRVFRIESDDGGWNEIKIEKGTILISDADCPDRTCVKTGALRSAGVPIVCLPHKLVIRYSDDGEGGE